MPDDARSAVDDFYFDSDGDDAESMAGYDRAALTARRWSPTTLCGREWAVMVGGEGGAVGIYGRTAFAPTCKRCLTLMDRFFPSPALDSRHALIVDLVVNTVMDRGFAEVRGVPGDQQGELRRRVRQIVRRRSGYSVQTYSIQGSVHLVCDAVYKQHADEYDRQTADAVSAALSGEPVPRTERDRVISWDNWSVD